MIRPVLDGAGSAEHSQLHLATASGDSDAEAALHRHGATRLLTDRRGLVSRPAVDDPLI